MGKNTEIGWTDHTFNPWVGCERISPGCDNCYAEMWSRRAGEPELWQGQRRRTTESNWRQPLKWNAEAKRAGVRKRVFCASLADVFDNQVPPEWRADLWALIRETSHLDWLLLTKRPQNIAKMLPGDWGDGWPNVWLGTTVENQEEANRRIPHLLNVPAVVRFLSCEPLLEPVEIPVWGQYEFLGVDWVIVGGESGPKARPMHLDWARGLRNQCERVSVPFFFKQWGEYSPRLIASEVSMSRVGKKAAGNTLDGREWLEFPEFPARAAT